MGRLPEERPKKGRGRINVHRKFQQHRAMGKYSDTSGTSK